MIITDFGIAIVDGDSHLSKWILEQRKLDVDGSAHEMARRFIKDGDVALDGGALLGDHTIVYLKAVGDSGTVLAFEPNPIALECLKYNCPEAVIYPFALGEREESGNISMGSMENKNLGSAQVYPVGPVRVMTLDGFNFQRLNFMKLDIEGMELAALRGGEETLRRCRPVVMAEINHGVLAKRGINPDEIFQFMKSLGYSWELRDSRYGLDQPQTDVLFIP